MRTFYALVFSGAALYGHAQTITTLNSNSFSPGITTIQLGETVTFNVSSGHTATQVSEATWMANGSTPLPGGFNFSTGSHEYTPTEIGMIYFVCQPHSSMGMKGTIIVESTTGIEEATTATFRIFPNPVAHELNIEAPGTNELQLIDVQGREVMRRTVNGNDRIDVAQIPEGNYTALLKDQKGKVIGTQRLTIAR